EGRDMSWTIPILEGRVDFETEGSYRYKIPICLASIDAIIMIVKDSPQREMLCQFSILLSNGDTPAVCDDYDFGCYMDPRYIDSEFLESAKFDGLIEEYNIRE
ncbi:MAG: hypothetical protein AB1725_11580, partial [Armatimonadota bacterium]